MRATSASRAAIDPRTPARTTTSPSSPTRAATRATAIEHYRAFLGRAASAHADLCRGAGAAGGAVGRQGQSGSSRSADAPVQIPAHGRPDARASSTISSAKTGSSAARRHFATRRSSATRRSTPKPNAIPKRSGRGSRASSSGRDRGTRCSTGSRRTRSGSSAASSTSASTASTATCATARRNKAALIWEGEPGDRRTLTYLRSLPRGRRRSRTCSKSLGVEARRSRRDLHAADPRARDRDARLRAHRRGPQRRVRRLQRRVAARPHQRRAVPGCSITADGGYRRGGRSLPLKQIADEALEDTPVDRARRRRAARPAAGAMPSHMKEGRDHWYHRADAGRAAELRARADGRRGHALHPLHVRHDRKAEGHRPHDRRLSRRHVRDDEAGLRSQGRRRLLVHRRHRLGHRPQLRRLRPARQRRDGRDVRRRARLAARRIASGR